MSEEKVIIDGIDVTECMHRFKHSDKDKQLCKYLSTLLKCEGRNCYFKQLQTTKEENEKLNLQIEIIYKYEIRSLKGQVCQLYKERKCLYQAWIKYFNKNKYLTQQNKQLGNKIFYLTQDNQIYKKENEKLKEQWDMCGQEEQEIIAELTQQNKQMQEALEDIKSLTTYYRNLYTENCEFLKKEDVIKIIDQALKGVNSQPSNDTKPQQKTFTVDEIKEIIEKSRANYFIDDKYDYSISPFDNITNGIILSFEKAVECEVSKAS